MDRLRSDTVLLLHDRRIARSKANIDHLAVTASGVFVIDAKKYRGRPHLKIEGGFLRPRVERLLDGDIPVRGVLCFVEADWPLLGGAFITRGVQALWPKKLYPQLQGDGLLTADKVAEIHRKLAQALPSD